MSDTLDIAAIQRATADGSILVASCPHCRREQAIPAASCFHCGSQPLSVGSHSGDGTLYSWSLTGVAFEAEMASEVPYIVAVVELRGGARIWGRLTGLEAAGAAPRANQPVFLDQAQTKHRGYLVFAPRRPSVTTGQQDI